MFYLIKSMISILAGWAGWLAGWVADWLAGWLTAKALGPIGLSDNGLTGHWNSRKDGATGIPSPHCLLSAQEAHRYRHLKIHKQQIFMYTSELRKIRHTGWEGKMNAFLSTSCNALLFCVCWVPTVV
jgi:hypothetical protein